MKKCSKCKIQKELACFCKCSSRKDGLSSECRECVSTRWHNNREKYVKRQKEYGIENRKSILAKKRAYTAAHRQEKAEYDKIYRKKNAAKIANYKKCWQTKNLKPM